MTILTNILKEYAIQAVGIVLLVLTLGGFFGYTKCSQAYHAPEPKERPDVRLSDEPPAMLPPRAEYDRLQHRPEAK